MITFSFFLCILFVIGFFFFFLFIYFLILMYALHPRALPIWQQEQVEDLFGILYFVEIENFLLKVLPIKVKIS